MADNTYQGKPCKRGHSGLRLASGHCVECRRADARRYVTRHPELHSQRTKAWKQKHGRAQNLRLKYGLTEQEYQAMASRQDGKCMICKKIPDSKLCVDHSHQTGKVRGLLCDRCNRGLGYFKDDPVALEAAAQYVRN